MFKNITGESVSVRLSSPRQEIFKQHSRVHRVTSFLIHSMAGPHASTCRCSVKPVVWTTIFHSRKIYGLQLRTVSSLVNVQRQKAFIVKCRATNGFIVLNNISNRQGRRVQNPNRNRNRIKKVQMNSKVKLSLVRQQMEF